MTAGEGAGEGLAARRVALAAIRSVEEGGWSNLAVPAAIADLEDERDRRFAAHLAYETVRWEGTLDWALGQVLRRPLAEVEPALRRLLRLGAVQLLHSAVPDRAVVDTAAALARGAVPRRRADGAAGFVNGVLRALARRRTSLPWPDPDTDPVGHLSLTTGHPAWIVEDLLDRFDRARVAAVLAADNDPPGLTLRATGDRDALVDELAGLGLAATAGQLAWSVRAPGADPRRLSAVAEGRAVPQDEASMRVVLATGVEAGDRVLDLCAGPGGKSTFLARLTGPAGRVTAVELRPRRAELIREAAARQGVAVDVVVGDATRPPVAAGARFDRVLVDAPCTGLGTGRRRPEVRWRRRPGDVEALAALQERLLLAAAGMVAPGGSLVYSVCTWTAQETVGVVAACADRLVAAGLVAGEQVQLMPDTDATDGMFVAVWSRPGGGVGGRHLDGGPTTES